MKRLKSAIVIAALVISALPLMAQQKRVSPHEIVSETFDGKRDTRVMLIYGRPYSKDPQSGEVRKIWGSLVPYDKVWRTGADEATLLILQKPIVIGGTALPAGAYTLFTVPSESGTSKLIINKKVGQWGIPYNEKAEATNELARIDLTKEALPADKSVSEFTMALEKNPAGGGTLKMMWETNELSVAFTIQK